MKRLQLVRKKYCRFFVCGSCKARFRSWQPMWKASVILRKASMKNGQKIHRRSQRKQRIRRRPQKGIPQRTPVSPDEQTEDIAETADGDTEDIALQSSEEDTERLPKHQKDRPLISRRIPLVTVRRASGMPQTVVSPASNISRAVRLRRKRSRNSWHPLII